MKKLALLIFLAFSTQFLNPVHAVQSIHQSDSVYELTGERIVHDKNVNIITRGKSVIQKFIIKKLLQPKKKKKRRKKGSSKLRTYLWISILSYLGGIASYIFGFLLLALAIEGAAIIIGFMLLLLSSLLFLVGLVSIILWFLEATRAIDELNKDKEEREKKEKIEKRKQREAQG